MKILLYHFGYRGDILVVGQNFTRELQCRFPEASIDLMIRPRMADFLDVITPLGLYNEVLLGEKKDFKQLQGAYDASYVIDECVYPEGNLRTPFTKAGFAFRNHPLKLVTTDEDKKLTFTIAANLPRPIIAFQEDMERKWPASSVSALKEKLEELGTVLVVGPSQEYSGVGRTLSFRESAALLEQADIYVGIDSGIAHAAALVGVQTILIPPVFPESWISPTEYANPFIDNERLRHISVRPNSKRFCGHYFCLKSTKAGGLKRHCGDPQKILCVWRKRWGVLKNRSCFWEITVNEFLEVVVGVIDERKFLRSGGS